MTTDCTTNTHPLPTDDSVPEPDAFVITHWQRYVRSELKRTARATWVSLPVNELDTEIGRLRLRARGRWVETWGVFALLLRLAVTMPLRGVLADDTGPLSQADLALRTNVPLATLRRCLVLLTHADVNLIAAMPLAQATKAVRDVAAQEDASLTRRRKSRAKPPPQTPTMADREQCAPTQNGPEPVRSPSGDRPARAKRSEAERSGPKPSGAKRSPETDTEAPEETQPEYETETHAHAFDSGSDVLAPDVSDSASVTAMAEHRDTECRRWVVTCSELFERRDDKQRRADVTSAETLFLEHVWPQGMDLKYVPPRVKLARKFVDFARKKGKKPMALLTKKIKDHLLADGRIVEPES